MKAKNTIRESRTDWNRLKEMSDSDIDYSDVPKLDKSFFKHAQVRMPKRKQSVSLRLDPDVLDWFKHEGDMCMMGRSRFTIALLFPCRHRPHSAEHGSPSVQPNREQQEAHGPCAAQEI